MTHNFNYSMQPVNGNFWFKCEPYGVNQYLLEADFTEKKPATGDTLIGIGCFNIKQELRVVDVIENHDSRGVYSNPEKAKGAFLKMVIEKSN